MGPVSQATHRSHHPTPSGAPHGPAHSAKVDKAGSTRFRYSTSRLSCLLSLRFGDGDTHYFERLMPGTVPLCSTTGANGRLPTCLYTY
jgi:hypothetical protein